MFVTKAAYDKVSTLRQLDPIGRRKTFPRNGQCSLTLTMQAPLPRQVMCCIFCARNVSKLLTSCSYQEISSYLYEALITSVMHKHILETELRMYCHPSAWGLRALFTLQSDLKGSLYSPAHCDDNRDPVNLLYLRTGDTVFKWEIQRSAHAFIYTHSGNTVQLLSALKPFHFWTETTNHSLKDLQGWPTEVTKMAQWASSIWQKTRYTLARLQCSSWSSNAAQRKQLISNNKILQEPRNRIVRFFLRTWECDNQPASQKLQRLCFSKRKTKKKSRKWQEKQWNCTTHSEDSAQQ